MIDRVKFSTGAAAGSAGSATSTGYSTPINGTILAVYVDYQGSPPAGTTDFTLSDEDDPASTAIVSRTNTATDAMLYPRAAATDNTGTAVTYDGTNEIYVPFPVHGRLEATIAGANAADYCDVTVWVEK